MTRDPVSPENRTYASTKSQRLTALAGGIGTSIEWFDFFVYSSAAALVFAKLFFPTSSPTIGLLESLATFGVAFAARPIGSILFGHFGDRIGRKPTLIVTLVTMGLATTLVGALPTYSQVGIAAPIMLVVLRILQGIAVGGEWGGAVGLVTESSPVGRRGFFGSLVQVGSPIGLLLSSCVLFAMERLPAATILNWGWRVPFLASIILVAVGVFVRLRIEESSRFTSVKHSGRIERVPGIALFRRFPANMFFAIFVPSGLNTAFYISTTFGIIYGMQHGLTATNTLFGLMIGAGALIIAEPLFGALSDRVGPKLLIVSAALFLALWGVPYFILAGSGSVGLFVVATVVCLAFAHAPAYGPVARFYAEMFDTRVRYTGTNLAFSLAGVVTSAPTPFLATYLFTTYHSIVPLVLLLVLVAILSVVSTFLVRPVQWDADVVDVTSAAVATVG